MSLVKLLGFETLTCGCVVGRYREVASGRPIAYVEEKGTRCPAHYHRRNHEVASAPAPAAPPGVIRPQGIVVDETARLTKLRAPTETLASCQ